MKFFSKKTNLSAICLVVLLSVLFLVPVSSAHATALFGAAAPAAAASTPTPAAATPAAATTPAPASNDASCSIFSGAAGWFGCVSTGLAIVAFAMFSFTGFLLSIVGILFNWVIEYTVFQFGTYFGNSTGVLIGWGILRDVGNIVLLFSFIFLGIQMILNLDTLGTRKAISQLLIVALLLNFSLFITEAVIDVSNVLSAALYNQATVGCGTNGSGCSSSSSNFVNNGIAGQILQAGGLNNMFTSGNGGTTNADVASQLGNQPTHKLIIYIMLTIFVSVTMVVLLAAGVMLLIRGIVLVFIMVTSPLGFVATIIPPLQSISETWRRLLISEAFFAPVYLLLVLVSLKITSALENTFGGGSTLVSVLSATNISYTSIILLFALVIGFMIASLMSAKQLGAVGATAVTSAATRAVRKTVTAPLRLGAFGGGVLYRNTVGKAAGGVQSSFNTTMGKLRTLPGVSGQLARLADNTVGGAISGGIGKVAGASIGGAKSYADRQAEIKARAGSTSHAAHLDHLKGDVKKGLAAKGKDDPTATRADSDARDKMQRAFQEMSSDDVAKVLNGMNTNDRKKAAKFISTDKFKAMLSHKDIDHTEARQELIDGRYDTPSNADYTRISKDTENYTAEEWELVAANKPALFNQALTVENPNAKGYGATGIKAAVMNDLVKKNSLSPSQKDDIRDATRAGKLKALYANQNLNAAQKERVARLVQNMSGKEFAELTNENIARTEHATVLSDTGSGWNTSKLKAVMSKEDTIDDAQKRAVLKEISDSHQAYLASNPNVTTPEHRKIMDNYAEMERHLKTNRNAQNFWNGTLAPIAATQRPTPQPPAPTAPTQPVTPPPSQPSPQANNAPVNNVPNVAANYYQGGGSTQTEAERTRDAVADAIRNYQSGGTTPAPTAPTQPVTPPPSPAPTPRPSTPPPAAPAPSSAPRPSPTPTQNGAGSSEEFSRIIDSGII
jgi:hypothetical protein